ncbi:hypothetical protein AAC387_Pa05g3879 [Persea americana]
MVCSRKDDLADDGGSHQEEDQVPDEKVSEAAHVGSSVQVVVPEEGGGGGSARREVGIAERLRDIFRDEGDGDLLIDQSGRDDGFLQWLQALDLHVVGACRADERLKPLLKLNVSSGAAEDRLLAHLSQHFEAPEVGLLARCLCVPLVSVRVGKVIKKGNLLCPTHTRGNLNLTLLPSSNLRISFIGDDCCTEKLSVLGSDSESSTVTIEDISADCSGRSFLMRFPGGRISYFWCSEKSRLLGAELLTKMKDLLRKKPTLSQLTGISESRLDRFATHLRAYLLGSGSTIQSVPTVSSAAVHSDPPELLPKTQSAFPSLKASHPRGTASQPAKSHSALYQGSLSPRLNTFKDGLSRSSLFNRSGAREKFKRRGDGQCNNVLAIDNASMTLTSTGSAIQTSSGQTEDEKLSEGCSHFLPLSLPDTLPFIPPLSISPLSFHAPLTKIPTSSPSLFSPYYCWCPPGPTTLQYRVAPHLPPASSEPLSLPPFSSILTAARSSSSLQNPPLNLVNVPSLDLPAFFPDPLANISIPVSSFVAVPSSQQIPTFTPFMSDPIVHIPVIDVCSSGQGYLVSAGPTISTTIAPLLPNLVNPLIPEAESMMEKSARETLRLLIGSAQTNPTLMEMLPAALATTEKSLSFIHGKQQGALVVGSRGLYSGILDVGSAANGITSMGLVSLPAISVEGNASEGSSRRNGNEDFENWDDPSCMESQGEVSKSDK